MPNRATVRCASPGCTTYVAGGRCDRCRRGREHHDAAVAGPAVNYSGGWRARRLDYLTHHQPCALCGRLATVADHHPHSRRELFAMGAPDPDADRWLRPLCAPCHNRETQRLYGGWRRCNQR